MRREIEGIEELLEEEPDSRCTSKFSSPGCSKLTWSEDLATGCLDSLIHYKRLLVKLLSSEEDREEREKLNLECKEMLDQLAEIDPMRGNRYRDIGEFTVVVLG